MRQCAPHHLLVLNVAINQMVTSGRLERMPHLKGVLNVVSDARLFFGKRLRKYLLIYVDCHATRRLIYEIVFESR